MKLLIVSHTCMLPVGQQFYAEIEQQTGWDLTVVTPSIWKDEYGNQLKTQRWSGYKGKIVSIPVLKSGSAPLHTYRSFFIRLLNEINPDFIYLYQEPYAIVTFQVYLANQLSIRKPIGFFTWQNIYKHYPFPFRQLESWVLRQTHVMFSGSHSAEEVFRKKGYSGSCMLLPSGIDPTIYYPRPEAAEISQQLRKTENEVLIGYVGRIVEQKGLKTLLYALKHIQELPWRLVIVGAGSYESELNAIAQELQITERITRVGYTPGSEIPKYLSAFDALVLPSETRANWKEQFGRVIIESIACGTPVIGSDSGEIPHLIKNTGGGLVFSEAHPEAFASQLKRVILDSELRNQLTEKGQKEVLQRFTHSPIAQQFAETVENTLHHYKRSSAIAG